ncbi:amidase [Sphingomonas naphthae]|uniref:Amidase n=1 Tax=Sphingomonas naphthae TaxID=1813468 RepID=A0ABY7TPU9_9SPHN|nr:amidase [Sphingomonas naphthae]WCT75262.1 amidase [Sphingomonas naphthae]
MKRILLACTLIAAPLAAKTAVEERSITQLQDDLTTGRTTSVKLVKAYFDRIAKLDRAGPHLNSVIALNPDALKDAAARDAARKAGRPQGPLFGVPILIKDNIESLEPIPTTAGSLALAANVTHRDAPVVARLRAAGAIILGKTNLSEWANFRSNRSTSGWSGAGGLTRNPYATRRSACGSSSGSGAAAAASLAAAAIGTETDGSVTCPAAINGLVGLKPTVGLVSRSRIIPISPSQDTAGPMTRDVRDAAILLTAMAGTDPADPATAEADTRKADYLAALDPAALTGKRIGVMRFAAGFDPAVDALFATALADLKAAGATLVEIPALDRTGMGAAETTILRTEFVEALNAYLATTPPAVTARTLDQLIAFNTAHADREMPWFGQETFEKAAATKGTRSPEYRAAKDTAARKSRTEGIDRMLATDTLDALIFPTLGPSWTMDLVGGDHFNGGGGGSLAAVAGYPHLTVPMGQVKGLPVGLSFIGPAWSEARLLALGYAYEKRTHRRLPPTYTEGP